MKKWEELTHDDFSTPRYQRATRTTNTIISLLSDFLPLNNKTIRNVIYDYVIRIAYESNSEFISVPPEFDALTKLELESKMLERFKLNAP